MIEKMYIMVEEKEGLDEGGEGLEMSLEANIRILDYPLLVLS